MLSLGARSANPRCRPTVVLSPLTLPHLVLLRVIRTILMTYLCTTGKLALRNGFLSLLMDHKAIRPRGGPPYRATAVMWPSRPYMTHPTVMNIDRYMFGIVNHARQHSFPWLRMVHRATTHLAGCREYRPVGFSLFSSRSRPTSSPMIRTRRMISSCMIAYRGRHDEFQFLLMEPKPISILLDRSFPRMVGSLFSLASPPTWCPVIPIMLQTFSSMRWQRGKQVVFPPHWKVYTVTLKRPSRPMAAGSPLCDIIMAQGPTSLKIRIIYFWSTGRQGSRA